MVTVLNRLSLPGALAAVAVAGLFAGSVRPVAAQTAPTAIVITAQPLYRGCNSFVVQAPASTAWRDIVGRVADPSTVIGAWRFDNPSQRYQAVYFKDPQAPLDGPAATVATRFSVWVCVSAAGSVA